MKTTRNSLRIGGGRFGVAVKACSLAATLALGIGSSHAVLPDVLFSAKSSDITTDPLVWPTDAPSVVDMTTMGAPSTSTINGELWAMNYRDTSTGFQVPGPGSVDAEAWWAPGSYDAIPVNGASIVVAVRPIRHPQVDPWHSIVDIFYDRLILAFRNDTGQVKVRRNGAWYDSGATTVPNGQITVLSLVVQPTGELKVFANGTEIISTADTSDMTELTPGTNWFEHYINVGRNQPDGWPVFNGNIGDVVVYKGALEDVDRIALENSLTAKYGTAAVYTINASSNTGGSIDPVGAIEVPQNEDQTFTITTDPGFVLDQVLVDSVNDPAAVTSGTYTFSDVTMPHAIEAVFSVLPLQTVSGVVTDGTDGVQGATVFFNTDPDASVNPTFSTTTIDAAGSYSIDLPPGDWYVTASEVHYFTPADATFTVAAAPVTLPDIVLTFNPDWDIIFSLNTDDLSGISNGERIFSWEGYTAYETFNNGDPMLGPTVETLGSVKWEKNGHADYNDSVSPTIHARGDGFNIGSFASGIVTDGVTIVAVVRPEYKAVVGEPRGEIVDVFYGELFLATKRNDGEVIVCTRGYQQWFTGYFIPDGQKTILSLVVQPTGEVELFANGVSKWTYASGADYTSLQWFGSFDKITVGRNGYDYWSAFNGNIGDVYLYRVALDTTRRTELEADLSAKFLSSPDDTDADGLLDSWELSFTGILDLTYLNGLASGPGPGIGTGDYDGDGTSDSAEQSLGLDPTDSSSAFVATIVRNGDGSVTLTWPSQMDLEFDVLWTDDLSDPGSWLNLGPVTDTVGTGTLSFIDAAATGEAVGFYQVVLKP